MTKDDILNRCTRILIEHLNADGEKVKPDARLIEDLGADSLDLVELVMSAEEVFGIEISDAEAETWLTIQDAVDGIDRLKN